MKKHEEAEGIVERMDFPNKGIVKAEGEQVLVKNALPGQKVRFFVSKKRHGKYEGRLIEVTEDSPLQNDSHRCSHDGVCGGCLYGGFGYENEIKVKEGQLYRMFEPVISAHQENGMDKFRGVLPSPEQKGYRNKMELSFGDAYKDGPLALGMHKRGSFYDIETCPDCELMYPGFREIVKVTLSFFAERKVDFYHKNTHEGYLRHLLLRVGRNTGEVLVDLVTSTQNPSKDGFLTEEELLKEYTEELLKTKINKDTQCEIVGILHTRNDRVADVVCDEGTDVLYGRNYFYDTLGTLSFRISPFSFFQTNTKGAELLYAEAGRMIRSSLGGDAKLIYDLYSGTGTITQMLSPVAKRVVGVEIVEEAVEKAKENAGENKIENCEFIAEDVLKALDHMPEVPDFIVLDPPRDGVHPKALPKILSYNVPSLIYISCKPSSLARDLPVFYGAGYRVEDMVGVDMFPGTGNVEFLCLLSKNARI